MEKFEVRRWDNSGNWYIRDQTNNYMHRDGDIVPSAPEFWLTEGEAQAVLDKYQPKPKNPLIGKTVVVYDR